MLAPCDIFVKKGESRVEQHMPISDAVGKHVCTASEPDLKSSLALSNDHLCVDTSRRLGFYQNQNV